MSEPSTISELLATSDDDATAIAALNRPILTYKGLRAHVGRTVSALNRLGIGRDDRVAIVLPNGPEMATAFLAIAAGATTAPLNPAYRLEEFDFISQIWELRHSYQCNGTPFHSFSVGVIATTGMGIDAVLTVVQEIGRLVGVETPTIDVVLPLPQQRACIAGCY